MPSAAHARLEALLRTRNLDRTLTLGPSTPARETVASVGLHAIDEPLGGGFPRGQLSELVGARSSGRTTVLHALMAAATLRGELVALVDSLDTFDPPSAFEAGVDLERMLWVRGPSVTQRSVCSPDGGLLQTACERALKAFNLILQAGGYSIVVLDLADMPGAVIRRIPFITWLRLQRVLEGREPVGLIVTESSVGRSARGLTLHLTMESAAHRAQTSPWQLPPCTIAPRVQGFGGRTKG